VSQRQVILLGAGACAAALGLAFGAYLAAEAWSPGAVGFPLLLAAPGLAVMATAIGTRPGRYLAVVAALAVSLLGLDVTDSARASVAAAGYGVALCGAVLAAGLLGWRRPLTHSG
jgi:hypothetical protein